MAVFAPPSCYRVSADVASDSARSRKLRSDPIWSERLAALALVSDAHHTPSMVKLSLVHLAALAAFIMAVAACSGSSVDLISVPEPADGAVDVVDGKAPSGQDASTDTADEKTEAGDEEPLDGGVAESGSADGPTGSDSAVPGEAGADGMGDAGATDAAMVCTPGSMECLGTTFETCNAAGTNWGTPVACPFVCLGAGVCSGTCAPGSTQCIGLNSQTCNGVGQWQTTVTCPFVCSGAGMCSGTCVPGSSRCSGSEVQTCDSTGTWQNTTSCTFVCSSGTCAGSCTPGALQCSGTNVQTCNSSGTWTTTGSCPFVCTGIGTCSGVCVPGSGQCSGDIPQTCNASGMWTSGSTCPFVCSGAGVCSGSCVPTTSRCNGSEVQTCDSTGTWKNTTSCQFTCSAGACATAPSCQPGGAGLTNCGPSGSENCCASPEVPGGTFYRSYDGVSSGYTSMAYPATVSGFRLDRFDITVGRFRQFVSAWNSGWSPASGSGKHSYLNGGLGLANSSATGTYEAGWNTTYNANLATTSSAWTSNLTSSSCGGSGSWTASQGANENQPINCIDWYEAYAFCIWDGGFLPSEAEWNYAAAGGSEQRVYPWSTPATSTSIDCSYANYCVSSLNNVGSESPNGDGLWGQADLAGDVWQDTLDWYASYVTPCTNCAYLTSASPNGTYRGGGTPGPASELLVSFRGSASNPPTNRYWNQGARCGRAP